MKAAVLTALNAPLEIADVQPCALEYGQVLVRVLVSGICGAQLAEIRGEKGNGGFLPHLLGHEGCGFVEDVGVGVTHVKRGDKVVMHWRKGAGIEAPFPKYVYNGRTISSGKVTTFSEYSICSENRLTRVPDDTPRELCALLGCGLSTALATIERDAAVKQGESVLVVGCGGLGVNLLRAAALANATPIVSVDVIDSKRATALDSGADDYFSAESDGFARAEKAHGRFDVIIDTAGSGRSMEDSLPLLAPSGRYVMVGQPAPGKCVCMNNANHLFAGEGKTIKATQGGGFRPEFDVPRYVKLWRAGILKIDGIVTHRVPLSRINEGLDMVREGQASRVMVEIQ